MNHTPGLWRVYNNPKADSCEFAKIGVGAELTDIAFCDLPGISSDEAMENARLIAAAPELLEALETLMQFAPNHFTEDDQYVRGVWRDAAAAIAKAKGKETP